MTHKKIYLEMNSCINWFVKCFGIGKDEYQFINEIMEITKVCINDIIEIDCYHSGGGCLHYFLRLKTKQIISVHRLSESIEISYSKWNKIYDYIMYDQDENKKDIGFGYEPYDKDFNLRTIELY